MKYRSRSAALTVLLATALTACGGAADPAAAPDEAPHGYVEGAEETAEVQSRLVVADAGTGTVRVLDLTTGEITEAGTVDQPSGIDADGRFAYVTGAGGTTVVDGGAWTVDHGDHVHYYRTAVATTGTIEGTGPVSAHADPAVVTVVHADGVTLLDRVALDAGTVTATDLPDAGGIAVPYGGTIVGTRGAEIIVRDGALDGDVACPAPAGQAVTRRGAVIGCADGAVLVSEDDGAFTAEKIPYPEPVTDAERARAFHHRPGSAGLAARAGDAGVWFLDLADRAWTRLDTGPAVAVSSAGEEGPVLALDAAGTLSSYDPATGAVEASTPLIGAVGATAPVIEVDTTRAYVNDPAAGVVHEIDYADALRTARTFDLGGATFMVETGR